jgi:sec-independent protein translocase protein TatA
MIPGLGIWELVLIFLIVMVFFGAKRIPVIGRGLGAGIRNFKGELSEADSQTDDRSLEEPTGTREDTDAS